MPISDLTGPVTSVGSATAIADGAIGVAKISGLGTLATLNNAPAGTLTGNTLAAGVTASSLTSVGTLATLTVTAPINGSVTGSSGSTSGNAATATALQTARTINGVSFDGTANITITAAGSTLSDTVPISKGGTGATTAATAVDALGGASSSGSGGLVRITSASLITPDIGVATATSVNKVAITAPATSSTLTIANGKTLTANNSITLSGTDSTTMTFPATSATIARTDAAQTFTGTQTFSGTISGGTIQMSTTYKSTSDNTVFQLGSTSDITIGRNGPANLRQGAADAASPVAQTSSVQGVAAGTSNTAGQDRTYTGSASTGDQVGGGHVFKTTPAGSSGTTQNAQVTAFSITGLGTALTTASTTARSGLRIPSGTAPTSPTSGDFWYDGTNLKFQDGATTRTLTWT